MSFKEYIVEYIGKSKPQSKMDLAVVSDFLDIMNNFKNHEQNLETSNRKTFPLFFQKEPEKTFPKIDRVVNELMKYKRLRGKEAILKFLEILKNNGYFSDSRPVLDLVKKFGSEVLDLYVTITDDEDVPAFLKKRP